jgi:hypothetical protein
VLSSVDLGARKAGTDAGTGIQAPGSCQEFGSECQNSLSTFLEDAISGLQRESRGHEALNTARTWIGAPRTLEQGQARAYGFLEKFKKARNVNLRARLRNYLAR